MTGCALYKSLRIAAPEQFGLTCDGTNICVEDPATRHKSTALVEAAIAATADQMGPFESQPRVLFCSTEACFARFSNPDFRALHLAGVGIVVSPRGWLDHILRHEVIHARQTELYGKLAQARTAPRWFIEGMAYSLSGDHRNPLPSEQLQNYRDRFEAWRASHLDWLSLPAA